MISVSQEKWYFYYTKARKGLPNEDVLLTLKATNKGDAVEEAIEVWEKITSEWESSNDPDYKPVDPTVSDNPSIWHPPVIS